MAIIPIDRDWAGNGGALESADISGFDAPKFTEPSEGANPPFDNELGEIAGV